MKTFHFLLFRSVLNQSWGQSWSQTLGAFFEKNNLSLFSITSSKRSLVDVLNGHNYARVATDEDVKVQFVFE